MATKLEITKDNYRVWLQNMYYKNCEELESYNLPIYKSIKAYETKNQDFLQALYLKQIQKI
tara:strand:+ start:787 stop:969 length:183 start_codon:yes stop_codon:yes gene_type:complete